MLSFFFLIFFAGVTNIVVTVLRLFSDRSDFQALIESHPSYHDSYYRLGLIQNAQGDTLGAQGWYTEAMEAVENINGSADQQIAALVCDWI